MFIPKLGKKDFTDSLFRRLIFLFLVIGKRLERLVIRKVAYAVT